MSKERTYRELYQKIVRSKAKQELDVDELAMIAQTKATAIHGMFWAGIIAGRKNTKEFELVFRINESFRASLAHILLIEEAGPVYFYQETNGLRNNLLVVQNQIQTLTRGQELSRLTHVSTVQQAIYTVAHYFDM